jgi:hypothetical protein
VVFIENGGIFLDKFGVFKLLNSFLNTAKQQSGNTNGQNEQSGTDFINAISSILQNGIGAKPNAFATPDNPAPTKKVSPPLQSAMLNTMRSHDDFVKRVTNKNNS